MRLPEIDDLFEGKYLLLSLLGEGGFARVFRARDEHVGRDVAIKVLIPGPMGYPDQVARRFMREAKVIASLHHPNTITMFEFGRSDSGLLYMVFEYAEGQDLSDVLRARGALPAAVVLHIVKQLLGALAEAHAHHVLHRDIKPANIILFDYMDDAFRVKLIDFGIAKPLVEKLGEPNTLTRDGVVVGTPRYMAPEQFFGEELTPAADVYSLGLVAYEMLVGSPAIDGANQSALVKIAVSPEQFRVPEHMASTQLRRVLERMMARVASERFADAGQALAALQAVRDPNPEPYGSVPRQDVSSTSYASYSTLDEPSNPRSDSRRFTILMAALVLLGMLVAAVAWFTWKRGTTSEPPPRVVSTSEMPNALLKVDEPAELVVEPIRASETEAEPDMSVANVVDGCGEQAETGHVRNFTTRVGIHRRAYSAYAPQNYDIHRRHPVVLLFHRNNRDPADVMNSTQFPEAADEHLFVVIALGALDGAKPWTAADDVDAVNIAIDEMAAIYCLDRTQVFAVGDGAGGRYAANLGCQRPLSGAATFGYGQYPNEKICVPETGPVPMLRAVGKDDPDVPNRGGPGCMGGPSFIDIDAHRKFWRQRNSCRGKSRRWSKFRGGVCETWSCKVPMVHCEIDGGHDWPGAARPIFRMPACEAPPGTFPLASAIWQFFETHGRTITL